MRIPNILHYFRVETEGPILRMVSLIFITLVTAIIILCFLNTNQTIDFIWKKEHLKLEDESKVIKRDFELQIDIGLRVLNTSKSFYEVMKHDLTENICDGNKAICSGTALGAEIDQMYKVMMLMYNKLYSSKNSLVFYVDSSTRQYVAMIFQIPELKVIYGQLNMSQIIDQFQGTLDPRLSYVYFFNKFNHFVSCLRISAKSPIYTCILIDHQALTLSTNRTYLILLNDQLFYTNYHIDIFNVNGLMSNYVEYLASHEYISYDDTSTIVDECNSAYLLFDQNGLFECMYSKTKLWSFSVLFEQLYIVLPNLYYKKLSYFREEYVKSNIKLIIIPDIDNCYVASKTEIDGMKELLERTMRYSVIVLIGLHVFFMINRLFVQYMIVDRINRIGHPEENQSKLISKLPLELKSMAETIQKYQWVIEYSKSSPENHQGMLLQGLEIFSTHQYQYISIIRHLYTTLISICQKEGKHLMASNLYERLIDLEMNQVYNQEEKINPNDINQIYELELNRIECYDRHAEQFAEADGVLDRERERDWEAREERVLKERSREKEKEKLLGIGLNQLFERLEEYKENIEIDERLLERGVVLKIKLKYVYGIGNSFRLLEQLENSDCEITIKNQVRYIYAIQLRKKKPLFDYEALDKLTKILKSTTTAEFKRKALKLVIEILNDYLEEFSLLQSQLTRICNFYNYKKKSIFIRKQSQDRNYDKVFQTLIKDIHTLFGKSLGEQKNNLGESCQNLYDSHLTSMNNMSFHSDLKQIAESSSEDSKFVIIYLNDLINPDKQKEEKREFQGIMQSTGTFLHIIVVGVNLKQDLLNKHKLIRLLKEKNNLIYIDLHEYDSNSVKKLLQPFIE